MEVNSDVEVNARMGEVILGLECCSLPLIRTSTRYQGTKVCVRVCKCVCADLVDCCADCCVTGTFKKHLVQHEALLHNTVEL